MLLCATGAVAVSKTWDNGGGDNLWTTAANWNPDGVPGSADDVNFNTGSASCFFNAASTTVASVTMTSGYTGNFHAGYAQYGKGIRGLYHDDWNYLYGTYSRVDATVNFASDWTTMPSGLNTEYTRIAWRGYILPQYSETYTFYETSDDGATLIVNGTTVISQWANGGMTEYSGTIALTANTLYYISYEYYQGTGAAGAILQWSSASQAKQVIPQARMFPDHNGLKATWYSNTDLTGTSGSVGVPFVNFDWDIYGPDEFFTNDNFSGTFEGHIVPEYTETYTFYSTKDDGLKLWINNVLILDSWTCGCTEQTSSTIDLVAGVPYYIYMEYRDTGGAANLNLQWSSASQAKQVVPHTSLFLYYGLSVTGNADFRSGGQVNWNKASLSFSGSGAQTFIPKSGATFGRIFQSGTGTTTVTTNNLTVLFLRVDNGTFHLGTGRTVTPTYMGINGGTVNFGTSTLVIGQTNLDWSNLGSATSGAAGSALTLTGTVAQTMVGTLTGADLDVNVQGTQNVTISGNLSIGAGTLTKTGTNLLTLTGNNSGLTGPITVSAGTLAMNHTSSVTYNASSITNNATVTMNPTANAVISLNSQWRGSGTWNIDGPGGGTNLQNRVLNFGNATASDATGPVNVINSGKLWLEATSGKDHLGPTQVVDIAASAVLAPIGTGTRTIGGLTGSGTVNNWYNLGSPTLEISNSGNYTFSGIIKNDVATLPVVKSGTGTQTLSGANTFSGGFTINAGILVANHATALGSGTVTSAGGTISVGGGITVANNITISACNPGSGQGALEGPASGASAGTLSGTITVNSTCSSGGHLQGGSGTSGLIVTGAITSTTQPLIVRDYTVRLSGGGSYSELGTGAADVVLGVSGGIPANVLLNMGGGVTSVVTTTFDLNGIALTVSGITQSDPDPSGDITNSGAAATLTVSNSSNYDYPDVISGAIALTKSGTGTQTLSGANTYSGATNVTAGTLAVTGSVIGTQSLILNNGGNVTNSGTITLSTDATGVFGVGYGATGTSTFTMTAGALNIGNGGGRTFIGGGPSGGPYGTGVMTVSGGTVTVAAAGAFPNDWVYLAGYGGDGTLNLDGGVFLTSRGIKEGAGTNLVQFNGGTLRAGFASTDFLSATIDRINIRNGGGTIDNNGNNITINKSMLHSNVGGDNATDGGMTFSGAAITILISTSSAYTGPTTVSAGTLRLGAAGVIPNTGTTTVNGTLDMNAFNETLGALAGSGTVDNLTGVGTYTLTTGGNDAGTTFSGILKNTSGTFALIKSGTGQQILSGNNTYTGGTTINAGSIRSDHANGFGTGTVTVNAGAYAMIWAPSPMTVANNWVLNGSSGNSSYPTLTHDGGGGAVTLSGAISVTAASEIGMGGSTSNTMTLSGVISGSGNITVDEANGATRNTLIFSGANTFTGTLLVYPGTLRLGAANVIPDGVAVTVQNANAILDLYGQNETIGSLAGDATVDNTSGVGTYTLTTGGDNTSTTFSGIIKNTSGTVALAKSGSGTMTLSGANTYNGATTISAGILKLGHATGALGTSTGATTVASGAALDLNGTAYTTAEGITIAGTGVSSGGAIMNSSSTAASYAGLVTQSAASSIIAGTGNITLGNTGTIAGGAFNLTLGGAANGTLASIVGISTAKIVKQDAGTWTLTGASTYTGGTDISAGTLSIAAENNLGAPSGATLLNFTGTATVAVTGSFTTTKEFLANGAGEAMTFDIASGITLTANGDIRAISPAGSTHKTGAGTLIVGSQNEQFDTDLYLDAGTVDLRGTEAIGNSTGADFLYAAAGTTVKITGNSAVALIGNIQTDGTGVNLVTDRTSAGAGVTHTFNSLTTGGAHQINISAGSNVTSGTGGLSVAGTTTLGGNATFDVTDPSGATTLTWTMAGTVSGAYSIAVSGSGNTTISGAVQTGSGTFTKNGTGTLILSGTNTYTGATAVNQGLVQVGSATAFGTNGSGTTVASGAAVDLNGTNYSTTEALTISGTGISSSGVLYNANAGAATFAGLITLGAASTINGGTGTIALSNAGTITGATFGLTLGGAQGGTVTSIIGTTSGTVTKADAGTWTLNGNSTYTGATSVSAGTLKLGHANAMGTTAGGLTVSSGATLDLNGQAVGAEAMTIDGTGVGALGALVNTGGAASISGAIGGGYTVGGAGDITLSGGLGVGGGITKIGTHTLTLSGTVDNNGIALNANAGLVILAKTSNSGVHAVGGGGLNLGGGTVRLGGSGGDQIYDGAGVTVNTGTLDLYGFSETVGSIAGSGGVIDNTAGAGTFTLTSGADNGSTTYSGVIQNTSQTLALAKIGSGTLTLSGANTYSGTTTVSAGILKLSNTAALGATTNGTTVASGGALDINGLNYATTEALTLSGTGVASGGALLNSNATGATWAGALSLGATASIIAGTGSITLTSTTAIADAFGLTLGGAQGGSLAAPVNIGNNTLGKDDAGTWTLTGTSTWNGGSTITAGTLVATTTASAGTGTIRINGGTFHAKVDGAGNDGTITFGNAVLINASLTGTLHVSNNGGGNTANTVAFGVFSMSASTTANLTGANGYKVSFTALNASGSGAGNSTVNPTSTSVTIGTMTSNANLHTVIFDGTSTGNAVTGAITDNGSAFSITKSNTSAWSFAGTSTYTGATTINGGTFTLTGSLGSGSAVTVNSGATLAGTGTAAGLVTVASGATVQPGVTSTGTLSTGALVLNNTTVLDYTLGPYQDKIAAAGNLTLDGTINVTLGPDFNFGQYVILTYTGTLTNNTLNVGTLPSGYYGTVTASGGQVLLNILDYTGWRYGSTINFNTTSSGANVTGNVNDFPLLVRLDSSNFMFEQAMSDGRDIRFADKDGSPLFHEIERWSTSLKKAEIWVKVPQVDGNSDDDFINFFWGNPTAPNLASSSNVFGTANYFQGVWHLNNQFNDATSNANNGTNNGSTSITTGAIGLAQEFNGSSHYVTIPNHASLNPTSAITVSAWFRADLWSGGNRRILQKHTSDNQYILKDESDELEFMSANGADDYLRYTSLPSVGIWHHLMGVYDGATRKMYLDGVQVATESVSGSLSTQTGVLDIGRKPGGAASDHWDGGIDEVRVESAARSADWAKLAYETQKAFTTAVTYPNTSLATWAYNTKIYVNTSATGANTTSDVANFPLLVRLSRANFDFSQARSDGADLRFADTAGNLLAYQVERFDAASKAAEIWVLLPTVKASNNSQWFRMYWGKGNTTSLSSGSAVFKDSHNFAGVWHLNEDGNTAAGGYSDATGLGSNGTGTGLTAASDVDAVVGKGTTFDGSTSRINVTANNLLSPMTSSFTVSGWVKGTAWGGSRMFAASRNTTSNGVGFGITSGGELNGVTFGVKDYITSGHALSTATWYHVAFVMDGSYSGNMYVNGVLRQTVTHNAPGTANTDDAYMIGANQAVGGAYNEYFNGVIDEIQVSNTIRTASWLKLSYENQKSGSAVVTVGQRSADFTSSLRLNFNTTASGANVSGNVANIPILVRLNASNFDFSKTQNSGTDIQFIDRDGTYLYHEVVEWDKANKAGKVWVKVPQVDGNSLADYVTLYYGCATCPASAYALSDSVWSSYAAAYHMNGSESPVRDATRNDYHLDYQTSVPIQSGLTTPTAPAFSATVGNYAMVSDPADGTHDVGTGDFTLGMWVKSSYAPGSGNWPYPVAKMGGSPSYGYDFFLGEAGANAGKVGFDIWSNGTNINKWSSAAINDGAWHHVVGKKTAAAVELFVDGVSQGTTAHSLGTLNNANNFAVGGNFSSTYLFSGNLNQVYLAKSAFTADFIKLSFQNQKENSLLFTTAGITTSSFTSSKVFKFNTTASGANVPGDVYNFPLLLRFTDATLIDATQSAGQDIRFLDADGVTWLDYQIERWDQANNLGEIWVKVPKIDGNSAGDFITMYYNDLGVTLPDGQCGTCVFGDDNGFKGAWHLSEDGSNTAGAYQDASSGGRHGTGSNMNSGTDVAGHIGTASSFASASSQLITTTATGMHTDRELTLEAWVNSTSQSTYKRVIGKAFTSSADPWSEFSLESSGSSNTYAFAATISGTLRSVWTSTATSNGTWYHVAGTFDGTTLRIYHNGVEEMNASYPGTINDYGRQVTLGGYEWAGSYFDGMVDEPRVHHKTRSADWIKLTYETQKATPTLFNPSLTEFVSSQVFRFNTTRTGANVMSDVENFPMLVRITGATVVDAVQDDWDDIRFLDNDGKTWLQYQVERWDKTGDVAEVWVLVPKVDGNSDRDFITLYYNDVTNGAVPNGQCAACVFGNASGVAAAWHMGDNAANATVDEANGSANDGTYRNVTTNENTSGHTVAGTIGNALDFQGGTAGAGQRNNFSHALSVNRSAGTVSHWVRPTTIRDMVTYYEGSSGTQDGFSAGATNVYEHHLGISAGGSWYAVYQDGSSQIAGVTAGTALANTWAHVAMTWNTSDSLRLYVNGVKIGTDPISNLTLAGNATTVREVGRVPNATENRHWYGRIDEIQVSNQVRSADWMKLSYETQRPAAENLFWNARPGPNNRTTLTATPGSGAISLAWTQPVSDSANADSVGIWVRYSGAPDSAGATGQSKVVFTAKTDSAWSYPATYPGTYYFGLAVRNSAGKWSPMTAASIDTVYQAGNDGMYDTIYVDSALGTAAGGTAASCTNARNPATPLKEIEDAVWCAQSSGFVPNDSLIIRVLPGTYSGNEDNTFAAPSTYPVVIESFDINSRAVLGSAEQAAYTVRLASNTALKRMDVRAATDGATGIQILDNADSVIVDGCRIYNNGNVKHAIGVDIGENSNEGTLIANTLIHEPTSYGVYLDANDRTNIINNVFVGTGAAGTKGIYMPKDAFGSGYQTLTNNIFYNLDYGIHTTDANSEVGVVSNNLFHLVTSGQEVVGETDGAKVVADPRFYSTALADRHAFKPLPGSPAIDGGTSTISTGAVQAWPRISNLDHFMTARPYGAAIDIGLYEGSGHTPNPTGDFDTLTNTVSGNTVIVKNSKWKLVWDMARGAGITGFYNMAGDSTANLVASDNLLFDVRVGSFLASTATSNGLAPVALEKTRARTQVRQRLAVSATLDLNVYYTVYPSGHIHIQSELDNVGGSTQSNLVVAYGLKLGNAATATKTGGSLAGVSSDNGFGFLNTSTRDALLGVTQDLDGNGNFTETWSQTAAVDGSLDSVSWQTADLADMGKGLRRHHHFLLYVGDLALDYAKSSALVSDAYAPSPVSTSAGSLLHERSWQDRLGGHWPLDEGAGTVAKDVSINFTNNSSAMTSCTWVSGKVGGALRFTNASVVQVTDNDALEVRRHTTIAFWFKPDFTAMGSTASIITKGTSSANGWHFRRVTTNKVRFTVDAATAETPELTTGQWYHVAGTVGALGELHLYLNGVLVSASTANAAMVVNTDPVRFGENTGANDKYAGDLDDIRLYHMSLNVGHIQAVYNRGYSTKYGHIHLRADNNNRVVALLNETAAQTRVQPSFLIDNWFGTRNPKYVYLNGTRLVANVDFVADSIWNSGNTWDFGNSLFLQVNKVLTGTNQTLFVDDNDSSGFMGEAAKMKALTITATANDKIAIQNFSGSTFGSPTSGQWYMELDLNGWSPTPSAHLTDTGFGAVNVWKAAAADPNVAVSSAGSLVGQHATAGKQLHQLKFDATGAQMMDGGLGYTSPANITYTIKDSSATRLSLVTATMTSTAQGTVTFTKRWTFYPTGRIFGSIEIATSSLNLDEPFLYTNVKYQTPTISAWTDATALATGRMALLAGDLGNHAIGTALTSIKSNGAIVTAPGSMLGAPTASGDNTGNNNYKRTELRMATGLFQGADVPVTVNFMSDFSRNFTDSATADSLLKDVQTPAVITALGAGTANPADALDFNTSADGFAEGDGAYVYTAGAGTAHFKFVNTVTHFNPAFRIKSWTFASLPEFVIVDNLTLTRGYHYNAYVNTTDNELVIQFNKTFAPGNHLFYISHKTGLAVSLNKFEAKGGVGEDTLTWSTESEFENLGFHLWRRVAPVQALPDSLIASGEINAGAGIANALLANVKATAAAKLAAAADTTLDTLPSVSLTADELKALGYVRITAKLIPGARGGSSASTQEYRYIDRSAGFGTTYEYLLETVDFQGNKDHFGPRAATPENPLETALLPNYPNPFNPVTTLRFTLREQAKVSLMVYDAKGRLVRTLIRPDKPMRAGKYQLLWDARDDKGFHVPSGQYFYRFAAPKYAKTRKMILVK